MVTRTITTTIVLAKVYNPETELIDEQIIALANKLNEKEVEKILNKKCIKVLKIVKIDYKTELTSMSDEEWIQHSHVIPSRGRKPEKSE